MSKEYQDPTMGADNVDVWSYSAKVGREESTWYKPWTWRNSNYVVEKHAFNRFRDEEVDTAPKHLPTEERPTGLKKEVEEKGKCWSLEQFEIFEYIERRFNKERWIEWWQINVTLDTYLTAVHDGEKALTDAGSTITGALTPTARVTGARSANPYGVGSAIAGGVEAAPVLLAAGQGLLAGAEATAAAQTAAVTLPAVGAYAGAEIAGLAAIGTAGVLSAAGATATSVAAAALPPVVITAVAIAAFSITTQLVEKHMLDATAEKISEGWEFVSTSFGPKELFRQAMAWKQVGPTRDCPKPVEEHWAQPQPQPRTGPDWLHWWWLWLLVALFALVALAVALLSTPRGGSVTGAAPVTALPTLIARLQPPSTLFTVEFPNGAPPDETYKWTGAIACGTFVPFSKTPRVPVSGGPTAIWTHPNAPLPPPDLSKIDLDGNGVPDYCPHSEVPNFSHPGTITVVMSDGKGGDAYCTYEGSLDGTGQCHLGKP